MPCWLLQAVRLGVASLSIDLESIGYTVRASATATPAYAPPFRGVQGHVDRIELDGGQLCIRGWAMHESGAAADILMVQVGERRWQFTEVLRYARTDLKQHFPMSGEQCGFQLFLSDCDLPDQAILVQIRGAMVGQSPSGAFPVPEHALIST